MTKQLIILVANIALTLTVFVGSSVLAQISTPNPLAGRIPDGVENPLGPIHVFQMDGSVKDDVENITATASNNVTSVEGYIGGAMHFDGTSYAEVPIAVSALDVPDMTFVAMVKLDDLPDDPDELSAVASSGYILSVGAGNALATDIILSHQNRGSANIYARSASAYVGDSELFATRQGIWHMVALTRKIEDRTTDDGEKTPHTILNLYINGRIKDKESVTEYKSKSVAPKIFFGAYSAGSGSKFRGSIDQVAFYDRALSKGELDEMRGHLRQSSRGASQPFEPRVAGRRGSSDNSIPDVAPAGGVPQQSPNSVDPRPAQFQGDQFDRDQPLFPGDQFDAESGSRGEQQFPGDQFESGSVDSRNARLLPGEREPLETSGILTGDRLNQLASDNLARDAKRARDKAARDEAVRQAGVENSNARDIATPLIVDSTAQSGGVRTPVLVNEAVRQAGIENSKTIDVAGSGFTPPNSREDDLGQITDTKEFQDMLKTADWRLVGVVRRSKAELYPGDDFTMTIRVKKDDPANKIPNVVLNVNPHMRGMANAVLPFRVMTSDQKPTASRDIPVTMTVPENLEFPDGADRTSWRLVARLTAENGYVLKDAIPDNHQQEIFLRINKPAVAEECDEVVENADGTRTAKDCLGLFGTSSPAAPDLGNDDRVIFKVDLSNKTLTGMSGYSRSAEVMTFAGRGALLGFIKIGERGNKPCRIAIDDGIDRGGDPGQAINKCTGSVNDSAEFRISPDRAITQLSVCQTGAVLTNSYRTKGVRVQTRPILEDGSLGDEIRYKDFQQTNCAKWLNTVSCPAGQVAGGIQAAFLLNTGGSGVIGGMGLVCGDIIVPGGN